MRILHIIGTVSPEAGGPSEVVRMLVEFAPAGVQSEIVSVDAPGADFLGAYGCPVHALGPPRSSYQYSARLLPWLRANAGRFDGVIVHGLWTYIDLVARRALSRFGGTPYVVFVHGMLDPYFKRRFPLKHAKKWVSWALVEYWLLRGARRVLFTTAVEEELARESFALWRWKPLVVPLGADAAAPDTPEAREGFFALCPEVRGARFLLFLGRIHPKKGCDLLVEAFGRQASGNADLHLVMAGPYTPEWQAELAASAAKAGVAERVLWPGMLAGAAKAGAFAACEAFVLPSHQENFGIAVVEAMAAGRPVLLSDKINIAAEIAADGSGFVESDTLDGTVRLLERWTALNAAEREAMGKRASATFDARYNMRRNTAAILAVFEG